MTEMKAKKNTTLLQDIKIENKQIGYVGWPKTYGSLNNFSRLRLVTVFPSTLMEH